MASTLDDVRRKVAAKIAKLLRRAERKDGPEADTARSVAEELMAKHGIEVVVHEEDLGPEKMCGERMVMFLKERRRSMWAQFLLQQMAPLYGCSNRQEQVETGWMFYITGPAASLEPCSIHFEFLLRNVILIAGRAIANIKNQTQSFGWGAYGSSFPREPSPDVVDGVHWGVMDGMLQNLSAKLAERFPNGIEPTIKPARGDTHTVTRLAQLLALPPAQNVAVRGDEVALPDDDPETIRVPEPDTLEPPQPPMWAWQIGRQSARGKEPEPPEVIYLPVDMLAIPKRIAQALHAVEVHTVAQLVRMRPEAVLEIPDIGQASLTKLVHALADHHLSLTPDWGEDLL